MQKKSKRRDVLWFLAAVLVTTLFVGLRTKYNDTITYINGYNYNTGPLWRFFDRLFSEGYVIGDNPTFRFLTSALKTMGVNSHWFIMITGLFTTFVYFWFMWKYSEDYFSLSVFFFMTCGLSYLLSALKQALATSFALIALDRYLRGRKISFYVLIAFSITIHPYSFLFLVVPLLFEKKPWTFITYTVLFLFLILGIFSRNTIELMQDVTGALGDTSYTSEYLLTGYGVNILRFLVYLAPVALSFVYRDALFTTSNRVEDLMIQLRIVSMAFMFLALFIATILVGRLPAYFHVPSAISLGWMLKKMSKNGTAIFQFLAVILFFIFFVYEEFINRNFETRYACISLFQLFGVSG